MTAGTSAVGRPSLLQAAVCHPSLSEAAVVFHFTVRSGRQHRAPARRSRHPAPAPGVGAGAVSWLCTWRQVAGAGCRAPALVLVL